MGCLAVPSASKGAQADVIACAGSAWACALGGRRSEEQPLGLLLFAEQEADGVLALGGRRSGKQPLSLLCFRVQEASRVLALGGRRSKDQPPSRVPAQGRCMMQGAHEHRRLFSVLGHAQGSSCNAWAFREGPGRSRS